LPSPAGRLDELAAVIDSPDASVANLAGIIARDVGMTAKVVQLVSSGFFGSPQHVASAAEVVRLLGLETVRALFAPSAGFEGPCGRSREEEIQRLTDHSFAVGIAARQIMETLTDDRTLVGDAHLAGVLHEVGTLALADFAHGPRREANAAPSLRETPGEQITPAVSNAAGPDPGGYLVALWGLPDTIVRAIAYHRIPGDCPERAIGPLTAVHVANAILEHDPDGVDGNGARLAIDYLEQSGCADRLGCWREICEACRPEGAIV
jgi:HD-like signal output (HDOD) protein